MCVRFYVGPCRGDSMALFNLRCSDPVFGGVTARTDSSSYHIPFQKQRPRTSQAEAHIEIQ